MPTVVGLFHYSGDADLAAAHLQEEYVLTGPELQVLGPGDAARLTDQEIRAGPWELAMGPGTGLRPLPGEDSQVLRRWGDWAARRGDTVVVARTEDDDRAYAIAADLRRTGAEPVDVIPG